MGVSVFMRMAAARSTAMTVGVAWDRVLRMGGHGFYCTRSIVRVCRWTYSLPGQPPGSLLLESMTPPVSEFVDGPARGCHYRNSRVTAGSNVGNSSGSNAGR